MIDNNKTKGDVIIGLEKRARGYLEWIEFIPEKNKAEIVGTS